MPDGVDLDGVHETGDGVVNQSTNPAGQQIRQRLLGLF